MDENLLFIPPCCVNEKLPHAIIHVPRRALTFYTHGDVVMEKFFRAISHLVADIHVMVLSMPVLDADTVVFLQQCFEREWIHDLVLSSSRDASVFVDKYLSEYRRHVLYVADTDVTALASHLVLYGDHQSLSLSGPMLTAPCRERLLSYTLLYNVRNESSEYSDWGNPLTNILLPDVIRHRGAMRSSSIRYSHNIERFLTLQFPPYRD